jgi:phosphoribosyl 1,2-cyclic phosphodiesterase
VRLLLDAGISGIQAQLRLAAHGRDIRDVDAVVISHDHSDHARSLGIFQRKFGLPAFISRRTLEAADRYRSLGKLGEVSHFRPGDVLRFGHLAVETIPTPHDGVEGVAFVVDDGSRRLGVLTDLGHPFAELRSIVASLDAVLLESNYDPQMLAAGPYPPFLKRRIRGPGGHLSNREAAELLCHVDGRLCWAALGHLSENNNDPALALATHREVLDDAFPLCVAGRYEVSPVWHL